MTYAANLDYERIARDIRNWFAELVWNITDLGAWDKDELVWGDTFDATLAQLHSSLVAPIREVVAEEKWETHSSGWVSMKIRDRLYDLFFG